MSKIIIVSGPSGVGKDTVCEILLRHDPNIVKSISATERAPREGEKDGKHYHFLSPNVFNKMIDNNQFLEWATYNGKRYGTPLAPLEETLASGKDVLLIIDVQGALEVMKRRGDVLSIFLYQSLEVLRHRLEGRKTETEEQIKGRLKRAEEELAVKGEYMYAVLNGGIHETVDEIMDIITKSRV